MRVVIDSNEFISGLTATKPAATALLDRLPELQVFVPQVVMHEVIHNLAPEQVQKLYALLRDSSESAVSYEPIPEHLVVKYVRLGPNPKGDAAIAAFAEWVSADYLISDNRHFLQLSLPTTFAIVSAAEFLQKLEIGD